MKYYYVIKYETGPDDWFESYVYAKTRKEAESLFKDCMREYQPDCDNYKVTEVTRVLKKYIPEGYPIIGYDFGLLYEDYSC